MPNIDYAIASDLSYETLQMRRRRFELTTPELDNTNRRLHLLPSHLVQREAFAVDRDVVVDTGKPERGRHE